MSEGAALRAARGILLARRVAFFARQCLAARTQEGRQRLDRYARYALQRSPFANANSGTFRSASRGAHS